MADKQVAATLAAALIGTLGEKGLAAAKKKPAEVAVEIYNQCLAELEAAEKKRHTVKSEPLRA